MKAVECHEVDMPIEPDLFDKHALYAMAWGIIHLPPSDGQQRNHQERVRIKRRCRAYAKARGWELQLASHTGGVEEWVLFRCDCASHPIPTVYGPLQACCRHVVEHDIWPEGKPKEDTPST